jgi:hypothetical protein
VFASISLKMSKKKSKGKCSNIIVSLVFPTFSHFIPRYFKATEFQLSLSKLWSESPMLNSHMYLCFRMELTPAPHYVPKSTYRLKGPADTRVSLKYRDSAAGSGCVTVQVSCWYIVAAAIATGWVQWLGAVAGGSGCCSKGTVVTAVRGE